MTNTDLMEPADEYVADLWIAIAKRQIREANEAQLGAVKCESDDDEKRFRLRHRRRVAHELSNES